MKTNNNELIISTIIYEYEKEYSRKEHLDSKIVGFLTFISLIQASAITVFIYLVQDTSSGYTIFLYLVNFIFVSSFSVSSIILCLFVYRTKESKHVDYNQIWNLYDENSELVEGTIFKSYFSYLEYNRDTNNDTEKSICTIYILLKIDVICFSVQLLILLISIIVGGI